METTTHPNEVNVGDKLTLLYRGIEIDVIVTNEPFEVETLDDDNKGWWQCGIRKEYGHRGEWFAVWTEDNPVWEVGEA